MQSVKKVISILEYVIYSAKPVNAVQVSKYFNMSVPNAYKYLTELQKCGLIIKLEDKTYSPSFKIVEYSSTILKKINIREFAHPFLVDLMAKTGQTVHLGVMENLNGVYIDKVEGPNSLPMISKVGATFDLYSTSLGKALLAFLDEQKIDVYLNGIKIIKKTKNTIIDKARLKMNLKNIKQMKYSVDMEENEDGIVCIGAPVFNFDDLPVASLSISVVASKVNPQLINEYADKVLSCANAISKLAGYKL
jgi:DNA-binding IclR family transcriptional regulator